MNFKFLLPLFIITLMLGSGCVVPYVDDLMSKSGMTANPVNQTLDTYSTYGYWKSLTINQNQYVVSVTRQTDGIKYLIAPPGYPYGYEGVLTAGASKTITISADKLNEMAGFNERIWSGGGIWRLGDTFVLTATSDSVNVQWTQTGNTDPVVSSFTVLPGETVGTGDSIEINADWNTGGDSDSMFSQWYLDGRVADGWIYVTPEQSDKRLRINGLPEGTHTVKLDVWDSGKNMVTITKTINVSYAVGTPTAIINVLGCSTGCTPTNSIPYGNSVILQSYSTSNMQDPSLQNLSHTWYLDGQQLGVQFYSDTLGYQVKIPSDVGLLGVGSHTVKLVVKNSSQATDEATTTFAVLSELPPSVAPPDTPTCPSCDADEQCVNGQCVPLPEASPLPQGTFTITVYNNQVAQVNGYIFRYRGHYIGKNDPSYQTVDWYIDEMALTYNGNSVEQWPMGGLFVSWNPLYQNYNILKYNPAPYTTLANWSTNTQYSGIKGGNTLDVGTGWSKSAKYFITSLTDQYATIQITETVNTFTYCGDGTCQENCADCPADCGICNDEQKVLYNKAPTAKFTYTLNGKQIVITNESKDYDGQIVANLLVFGDGDTKENMSTLESHAYSDYGTYTVTLFVTDNYGAVSKSNVSINVAPSVPYADMDTDGDSILNGKDSCIIYAETYNGYNDTDGCPDVKPIEAPSANPVVQNTPPPAVTTTGTTTTTPATVSGTSTASTSVVSGISVVTDVGSGITPNETTHAVTQLANETITVDIPYIGYVTLSYATIFGAIVAIGFLFILFGRGGKKKGGLFKWRK